MVLPRRIVVSEEYSMERYAEIISKAQDLGYSFPLVRDFIGLEAVPQHKLLLIRHDIDFSIDASLEMAKVEHAMGVATSYYVRMHCPFYNILDTETFRKILEIKSLGHEVGLHYEAMFYEDLDLDPIEGIRSDAKYLSALLGEDITSISQHNPSLSRIYHELWEDYFDAYTPLLIKNIAYFGDSGRKWREGCVSTKIGEIDQIHVLVHPYSWVHWHESWKENLKSHLAVATGKIEQDMADNVELLEKYLAERAELDAKRTERYSAM